MRFALPLLSACAGVDYNGGWVVTDARFLIEECPGFALPGPNIGLRSQDTWIEIDFQDGLDPITCDRTENSFNCPEQDVYQDTQGDAVLTTVFATEGTLGKTLVGTRTGGIGCVGDNCRTLEDLGDVTYPCALEIRFEAAPGLD